MELLEQKIFILEVANKRESTSYVSIKDEYIKLERSMILVTTVFRLNVRYSPHVKSEIMTSLQYGTEIEVNGVSKEGGWYKIKDSGYVYGKFVAKQTPTVVQIKTRLNKGLIKEMPVIDSKKIKVSKKEQSLFVFPEEFLNTFYKTEEWNFMSSRPVSLL